MILGRAAAAGGLRGRGGVGGIVLDHARTGEFTVWPERTLLGYFGRALSSSARAGVNREVSQPPQVGWRKTV